MAKQKERVVREIIYVNEQNYEAKKKEAAAISEAIIEGLKAGLPDDEIAKNIGCKEALVTNLRSALGFTMRSARDLREWHTVRDVAGKPVMNVPLVTLGFDTDVDSSWKLEEVKQLDNTGNEVLVTIKIRKQNVESTKSKSAVKKGVDEEDD